MKNFFQNKKIIILIILLLFAVMLGIMAKTGILQKINIPLFASQEELFSYIILDNQNENKVIVLANIHTENGIEYIEKGDGTIIYSNERTDIAIDYVIPMNEEIQIKIKEKGKPEVTKTIKADNETIENLALKINTEYQINGYKVLNIQKQEGFLDEYNQITYQIGQNGTWNNYSDKFPVVDYDVLASELDNNNNTVTITAKLTNPTTNKAIVLKKTYNLINSTLENQSITADSLLKAVEEINQTGTYNITVSDQTYSTRVYCFNEDMDININTSFGTESDVSTGDYAKNMIIVKVDGNLNNNAVLTSYASKNGYGGPKGMLVYATGDITNNGTISMTARGARAVGQNVYLWKNADESYEYVPAVGGAGGAGIRIYRGSLAGNPGINGTNRQTGGGASGAAYGQVGHGYEGSSGTGGSGTSYSGGTGGGAGDQGGGSSGSSDGGIGGSGGYGSWGFGGNSGGGAGNPGGPMASRGSAGENGTGGLLIIYSENIENNSLIESKGSNGGTGNVSGGGSGGGSINIFFTGTYSNTGTINTAGGTGGGTGGTGSISIGKIVDGSYIDNEKIYKITYDPNGGTGFMKTSEGVNSVTVAENEFTFPTTEKFFLSWNTKADRSGTTYKPGDTLSSNETLYAIWGSANYTKGEMVTLGTGDNAENFYVVADTDASSPTVTLLTEKCVNPSGYIQSNNLYPIKFDDSSNDYNRPSYIKRQVDAYAAAFHTRTNITVQEARLLYKSEADTLNSNILYVGPTRRWNFWLGTSYGSTSNESWEADGRDGGMGNCHVSIDHIFGLRPVIVVNKAEL